MKDANETSRSCIHHCYALHYSMLGSNKNRARRVLVKYNLVIAAGGKCSTCGYNKNISSLVFHHTSKKNTSLSGDVLGSMSLERLKKEVKQCLLLCHNCHNELHNPYLGLKTISKLTAAVESKAMTLAEASHYFLSKKPLSIKPKGLKP